MDVEFVVQDRDSGAGMTQWVSVCRYARDQSGSGVAIEVKSRNTHLSSVLEISMCVRNPGGRNQTLTSNLPKPIRHRKVPVLVPPFSERSG